MKFKELTNEQIDYMKKQSGMYRKDAWKNFNERFSVNLKFNTFKSWIVRIGVPASGDGRFTTDSPRWQKGLTKEEFKSHYTEKSWSALLDPMKESNKTRKVGDVIVIDGKPWIVTSLEYGKRFDQRREPLDRYIWEKHYGKIPGDSMLIHLNHNQLDCTLGNMAVVPKMYRAVLLRHMKSEFPEINKTTIKYLDLISEMKKEEKNREEK